MAARHKQNRLLEAECDFVDFLHFFRFVCFSSQIREAACASIAECAAKLDSSLLLPYLSKLLKALFACFGDDSWPARDAACTALGTLISCFPEATKQCGYPDLMIEQFLHNLSDSILSIRDGAAYSIARILQAADDPMLAEVYAKYIKEKLAEVSNQPVESQSSDSSRLQSIGSGVSYVTSLSDTEAHDQRHTNQTMYSCCSLGPKIKRGMHVCLLIPHHRQNSKYFASWC